MLSLFFLSAAVLKIRHFVVLQDWYFVLPLMTSPVFLWSTITLDLVIAVGLWSRWSRASSWLAVSVAIIGNLLLGYGRYLYGAGIQCGCIGRLPLSFLEHVIISVAVFALAAVLLGSSRPKLSRKGS